MNALKATLRVGGLPTRFTAEVTDANGNTICRVLVETVILVHNYEKTATITEPQAREAGYLLDREIASQAQRLRISKVMLAIPENQLLMHDVGCSKLRVCERSVNTVTPISHQSSMYLN